MNDAIAPQTRQRLKEAGLSEEEFLSVRENQRREGRMNEHVDEAKRILRDHFNYEKRKRERQAAGR